MLFLLANWRWISEAVVAGVLVAWLGVTKVELSNIRSAIAEQKIEAANELIRANALAAAKDAANAEKARNAEVRYAQDIIDSNASRDAFAEQLRIARSRKSSCSQLPSPAVSSGQPQDTPTGGDDGRRGADNQSAIELRDMVNTLQADVRECVTWANGVGR